MVLGSYAGAYSTRVYSVVGRQDEWFYQAFIEPHRAWFELKTFPQSFPRSRFFRNASCRYVREHFNNIHKPFTTLKAFTDPRTLNPNLRNPTAPNPTPQNPPELQTRDPSTQDCLHLWMVAPGSDLWLHKLPRRRRHPTLQPSAP